jgi:hypothetical protein
MRALLAGMRISRRFGVSRFASLDHSHRHLSTVYYRLIDSQSAIDYHPPSLLLVSRGSATIKSTRSDQ